MNIGSITRKLDGFFIISKTFDCLKPCTLFKIKQPLLVSSLKASRLTGCLVFTPKETVFKIYIGKFNAHSASLLFTSERAYFDFSHLLSIVISGINSAIQELPHSVTAHSWTSKLKPFFQQSQKKGQFIIYPSDLVAFGNKLIAYCENRLRACMQDFKSCFLLIGDTGYSTCATQFLAQVVPQFNLSCCEEVVIHFAYDISVENNFIFWRYAELKKKVPFKLTSLYFPGAFTGCANLYFFNQNISGQTNIGLLKFYSDVFKHVHNTGTAPFSSSEIGDFLLKNFFSPLSVINKTVDRFQREIQSINRLCGTSHSGYARLECTVSHRPSKTNLTENVVNELEILAEKVSYAYIQEENIFIAKKQDILDHFNKYVLSWTLLLENKIQQFLNKEYDCLKNIEQVYAAEAILCFFVYGNSKSVTGFRKHNNRLCDDVGLQKQFFLQKDIFCENILEKTISVVNNQIYYLTDKNVSLFELCGNPNLCQLKALVNSFSNKTYYKSSEFHFFFINLSVKLLLFKQKWHEVNISLDQILFSNQSLAGKNSQFLTSLEFVEKLFENTSTCEVVFPNWNNIFETNKWDKKEFLNLCTNTLNGVILNAKNSASILTTSREAIIVVSTLHTPVDDSTTVTKLLEIFLDVYKKLFRSLGTEDFGRCLEVYIRHVSINCVTFQEIRRLIQTIHVQSEFGLCL